MARLYTYYSGSGTNTPISEWDYRWFMDYTSTQNTAGNYSDVECKLYINLVQKRPNPMTTIWKITIDGTSWQGTVTTPANMPTTYLLQTKTKRIYHNSDGNKSIYVQGAGQRGDEQSPMRYTNNTLYALPTIPRYAVITTYSVSSNSLNTINVSWNVDSYCDAVQYSLNGGAWVDTSGLSFSIGSLSPGTQYSVKIRVKRADSQLWTESGTNYATTLANAVITNASVNFNIGSDLVVTFTNPSGSTVNLRLESPVGSTTRATRGGIVSPYTLTLSDAEKNVLYGLSPTTNTVPIRIVLDTISGGNTYYNWKDGTASIVDANPLFSNFTYEDVNATTLALTGSNQKIIKGYSNLKAIVSVANKAVAQKSATMSTYQLVVGSKQLSANYSSSADVNLIINAIDSNIFNLYAIDSRNNSQMVPKSPSTYIDYFKPYFGTPTPTIERTDGIGTETTLTFAGLFYNANFGSITNNVALTYKYKKTTEPTTWTNGTTVLTPTKVGNNFSFNGIIAGDLGASGFDANYSYNIEIKATDSLDNITYNLILGTGTPNLAMHQDGIGINMPYDETLGGSLQVADTLRINGTADVTLSSTNHPFQIGLSSGGNLAIDTNEIQSRNNGMANNLAINNDGGTVSINGSPALKQSDVVNNVTNDSAIFPLSANQGKIIYDLLKARSQHPIGEYILFQSDDKTIVGNGTWIMLGIAYDLKQTILNHYPLKTGYTRSYKLKLSKTDNKSSGGNYVRLQAPGGGGMSEYIFPITWGATWVGVRQDFLLPLNWNTLTNGHCEIFVTPDFATNGTLVVYQISIVIYDELI